MLNTGELEPMALITPDRRHSHRSRCHRSPVGVQSAIPGVTAHQQSATMERTGGTSTCPMLDIDAESWNGHPVMDVTVHRGAATDNEMDWATLFERLIHDRNDTVAFATLQR